jgi:hypothetical protein
LNPLLQVMAERIQFGRAGRSWTIDRFLFSALEIPTDGFATDPQLGMAAMIVWFIPCWCNSSIDMVSSWRSMIGILLWRRGALCADLCGWHFFDCRLYPFYDWR